MELVRYDAAITSILVVVRSVLFRRQAMAALLCTEDQRVVDYVRLCAGLDWNA